MQQPGDTGIATDGGARDETTMRGTPRKRAALTPYRAEIERWVAQGYSDDWIASALGTSRSSVQSFRSRRGIKRRGGPSQTANGVDAEDGNVPAADGGSTAEEPEEDPAGSVYEGVLDQGEEEGYGLWLDPAVADDPLFRQGFAGVSDVRVVIQRGRIVLEPASEQRTESGKQEGEATVDEGTALQLEMITGGVGESGNVGATANPDTEDGRVKWFDEERGYGFIVRPGGANLFFHRTELENGDALEAGELVSYEVGANQRGPVARSIRPTG